MVKCAAWAPKTRPLNLPAKDVLGFGRMRGNQISLMSSLTATAGRRLSSFWRSATPAAKTARWCAQPGSRTVWQSRSCYQRRTTSWPSPPPQPSQVQRKPLAQTLSTHLGLSRWWCTTGWPTVSVGLKRVSFLVFICAQVSLVVMRQSVFATFPFPPGCHRGHWYSASCWVSRAELNW